MPDPNLGFYAFSHNLIVWLYAHPTAWVFAAGCVAGWHARGRAVRYALGFGMGRR